MIRVDRGAEPPELGAARAQHLPRASAAFSTYGAPSKQLAAELTGYAPANLKTTLYARQHKKCAWCERRRDFSSSPVEHFRPKGGAWRHRRGEPTQVSPEHYWWLTWEWANLLFACPRCNDRAHKGNYFPLAPGTTEALAPARGAAAPMPAVAFDVSAEQPLPLDPAADTFLDHVRWRPAQTHLARKLWIWSPSPLTPRGERTIEVLGLDELIEEVTTHLVDNILHGVTEVENHLAGDRRAEAQAAWGAVLARLAPDKDFTAATRCALEEWMGPARCAVVGLPPPPRPR